MRKYICQLSLVIYTVHLQNLWVCTELVRRWFIYPSCLKRVMYRMGWGSELWKSDYRFFNIHSQWKIFDFLVFQDSSQNIFITSKTSISSWSNQILWLYVPPNTTVFVPKMTIFATNTTCFAQKNTVFDKDMTWLVKFNFNSLAQTDLLRTCLYHQCCDGLIDPLTYSVTGWLTDSPIHRSAGGQA